MVRRHAEGDRRVADLPLRAHEPLRHRRLGDEEGARDLVGLEAAERPQGQREASLERERRVAAREDQAQPLVGNRRLVVHVLVPALRLRQLESRQQLRLALQVALAADAIDRAVAGGGDDPRAGIARDAVARPALDRGGEGVLHRVLGEVEITEDAGEDRERAPVLVTVRARESAVGRRGYPADASTRLGTTGRTSIEPSCADGIFAAHSIASSTESTSIR